VLQVRPVRKEWARLAQPVLQVPRVLRESRVPLVLKGRKAILVQKVQLVQPVLLVRPVQRAMMEQLERQVRPVQRVMTV